MMNLDEYKAAVSRSNAEDCEACSNDVDACLFHAGIEEGFKRAQRLMNRALDEPESVVFPKEPQP